MASELKGQVLVDALCKGEAYLDKDLKPHWGTPVAPVPPDATGKCYECDADIPANKVCPSCNPATGKCGELVTVKPLDWRKYRNGDAEAVTPFGEIYTAYVNGYWRITRNGKAGKFIKATGGDDVDAAKAGAQADFDANVLQLVHSQAVELLAAERAENDEAYELGKRDGYSEAVQEIDLKTGGDGEYRYCTDHDPDRHTPDPASMIQRIAERFETLNTMESISEINEWKDRAEKAEADNAALTARVKELEETIRDDAIFARDQSHKLDDFADVLSKSETKRQALEAKLAAAERALEAIEDHAARCSTLSTHSTTALAYLKDIQDEARAALGGKPS